MKYPVTPAIRQLRQMKAEFIPHLYEYAEKGGTTHAARELDVAEARVVKTIVLEDDRKKPLIVLIDGEHEVSLKQLARLISVKAVRPCDPDVARKHTGYLVGGTSPFGTLKRIGVYVEEAVLAHDTIFINGGKRGFLVEIDPAVIVRAFSPTTVNVGI